MSAESARNDGLHFRLAGYLQIKPRNNTNHSRFDLVDVAFLMKDVVLLAVSFYLLKQDVLRVASAASIADLTTDSSMGAPESELEKRNEQENA